MDVSLVLFLMLAVLDILMLTVILWTLYEFIKLDKEQFRYYLWGLFFYGIGSFSFFLRYVIFPPLTKVESNVLGYFVSISTLIGIFYFVKGTEFLAKQENSEYIRNESLYKLVVYSIVCSIIYMIPLHFVSFLGSDTTLFRFTILALIIYIIVVSLSLKLLFEYKKAFTAPIDKIIYQYIIAAAMLVVGGVIATGAVEPLHYGGLTFRDLTHVRQIATIIGCIIIVLPYFIIARSVNKFRKLLAGQ